MPEQTAFPNMAEFMDDSKSLPAEILEEVELMQKDWVAQGGLILSAAVPGILRMSKANWYETKKKYNFVVYRHFEKDFFSRKELEAFYKLRRADGEQGPGRVSLKEIWNDR